MLFARSAIVNRELILYIAVSLDGFIAGEGNDLSFLSRVESPGEDYGYSAFYETVDTVIMGRKSYEQVLTFGVEFPHKGKTCYVISRSKKGGDEFVEFLGDDFIERIRDLKIQPGKNIFCDGGAQVVYELLRHRLIDRVVISIIPHLLGNGIRLFREGFPEQITRLENHTAFPSGLVQLTYTIRH